MTVLKTAGIFAMLMLAACEPKEIKVSVTIVTSACDSKVDPFAGVQYLRVRITGEGIVTPIDSVAPTGQVVHEINIPQIPAGKNRVIEVRGYDADPSAGGKTLSIGKSLQFEVKDVIADPSKNDPVLVNIFLRKVNAFTPPSSANAPKDCQKMKEPRAGHAATLLKNGKVFISGGYTISVGNPARVSSSDTEIYNPQTNSFESSREMSIANGVQRIPKAFHTATLLPNAQGSGQVLLWGGETYTTVNNVVSPSSIVLVYDPENNEYGAVPSRKAPAPASIPRSHHRAAIDVNGKVLIVGGQTRTTSLVPADQVEWFDPTTLQYLTIDGVSLPRVGACVAPVKAGQFIAVAGGKDAVLPPATLATEIAFFRWDASGAAYKREALATPPRLADPGRLDPACATLRDGADLLVMGGASDAPGVVGIASSEIVNVSTSTVAPGPTVGSRVGSCSVQLADGSVMVIGGYTTEGTAATLHSDGSTVIITSDKMGGAQGIGGPPISVPRYEHTCTALQDGSVLVTGGRNDQNGVPEILQDAWIYQPAPVD